MRAKSLILLVIALGCGMVASVGISQVVLDKKNGTSTAPTAEIFVAVKDMDTLQKVNAETVKLEKWPKDRLPEGAIFQLEELENKYTNQRLYAGEPILARKLMDSADDVSTKIPKGYRVFDLGADDKNGGVGYIKPGDHVDVVGTFNLNSVSESRTVMRNVKVFGVNGNTVRESDSTKSTRASTIQLLVKESQLEALTLASSTGQLRLSLRPPSEDEEKNTDNGDEFLAWMRKNDKHSKNNDEASREKSENLTTQLNSFMTNLSSTREKTEDDRKQLLIITPNGVTKYEWLKDDEVPQRVVEQSGRSNANLNDGPAAQGQWNFSAGNTPPGTGGYIPSYPTNTTVPGGVNPTGTGNPGSPGAAPNSTNAGSGAAPGIATGNGSSTSAGKSGGEKKTEKIQ